MKIAKKGLIILLICSMVMGLFACGGSASGQQSTGTAEKTQTASAPAKEELGTDDVSGTVIQNQGDDTETASIENTDPDAPEADSEDEKILNERKAKVFSEKDIVVCENGDTIYSPDRSMVAEDEDGCLYIKNLLQAFLTKKISRGEAEKLAKSVGGVLAGQISGDINFIQIFVKETRLERIREIAAQLMDSELVMYASEAYPIEADLPSAICYEPWHSPEEPFAAEEDPGAGEANGTPDGNDIAYEAVGAYEGWKLAHPVIGIKVGLMDNGVQDAHEELEGKITTLPGIYGRNEVNLETETSHGTNTASIICGKMNGKGIRGIADRAKITSVDIYNTNGDAQDQGTGNNRVFTYADYNEIIKRLVEQRHIRLICLESAFAFYDAEYYSDICLVHWAEGLPDVEEDENDREMVEKYLAWCKNKFYFAPMLNHSAISAYVAYKEKQDKFNVEQTAYGILFTIAQLIKANRNFLIVQAAGNGMNWTDSIPLDAGTYGGFAASITEEVYDYAAKSSKELAGLTYKEIRDHIIVVTGTSLNKNPDGSYVGDGTNYGLTVDIAAPSEKVLSAACKYVDENDHSKGYSTDGYTMFGGSSSATPMVTGAAALLWTCAPELSAAQVKECLKKGAVVKSRKRDKDQIQVLDNYPMLNIGGALKYANKNFGVKLDDTDAVLDRFIAGEIPATDRNWTFYSTDLALNSGYQYSLGERIDLDNDEKNELIINGFGGTSMYLTVSDGKVKVFAHGEGTGGVLGHTRYDGDQWIVHSDTTHAGRQIYKLERYSGPGNVVDSFTLSAEYWDSPTGYYNENSTFKYRDQTITMEEYEEWKEKLFGSNN